MKNHYVVPHVRNNTDSVCAAIAYANLERQLEKNNAQAIITNSLNQQTELILEKFQTQYPKQLIDVCPRAYHIKKEHIVSICENESVARALELYSIFKHMSMPCLNLNKECIGILQFNYLFNVFMTQRDETITRNIPTTIQSIYKTIKAKSINICKSNDQIENYNIITVSGENEHFKKQFDNFTEEDFKQSIFISTYNPPVNNFLLNNHAGVLIICQPTTYCPPTQKYKEDMFKQSPFFKAKDDQLKSSDTIIIETDISVTLCTLLVKQSTPVSQFVNQSDNVMVFEQTSLDDIRIKMQNDSVSAVAVIDKKRHLKGIVSRTDLLNENLLNITLVGCSSQDQAPNGIDQKGVFIRKIINFVPTGNVETTYPIEFVVRPYGSTCTVISQLFKENGIIPSVEIAGILLSGILIQTKLLKNQTTTQMDKDQANFLEIVSGVDGNQLGTEIIAAKDFMNLQQLVNEDVKVYKCGVSFIKVSQFEVTDLDNQINSETVNQIYNNLDLENVWLSACLVSDVIRTRSVLIYKVTSTKLEEQIQNKISFQLYKQINNCYYLQTLISRKMQLMPYLLDQLKDVVD